MTCPRCKARGKTWEGADPKCAFPSGTFRSENWNCATMNALRRILDEQHPPHWCEDTYLGVLPMDAEDFVGFAVFTWYKSRGRTDQAFFVSDTQAPRCMTLAEAELVIKAYSKEPADAP